MRRNKERAKLEAGGTKQENAYRVQERNEAEGKERALEMKRDRRERH